MALLQFQIERGASTFSFDVDGEFATDVQKEFTFRADPPELVRWTERWILRGLRLVANSDSSLWTELGGFLDSLSVRGSLVSGPTAAYPTFVRVVRSAAPTVALRALDSTTYQEFRIERIRTDPDPDLPQASYGTVAYVSLEVVAVRVFDRTGINGAQGSGLLDVEQTITETFPDALPTIEWRTLVRTREGVDARVFARDLGRIPIEAYGAFYVYSQSVNGPDGVELITDDADTSQTPDRVPTRAVAISRIVASAERVGVQTPGSGINDPVSVVRETIEQYVDGQGFFGESVITARASGPNAETFVRGLEPGGATLSYRRIRLTKASGAQGAEAEYRIRSTPTTETPETESPAAIRTITISFSGGSKRKGFAPMIGGFRPRAVTGPVIPARLTVDVVLSKYGDMLDRSSMRFPAILPAPWVLLTDQSREDPQPRLVELGVGPENSRYERRASIVYEADRIPPVGTLDVLREAGEVQDTYLYRDG